MRYTTRLFTIGLTLASLAGCQMLSFQKEPTIESPFASGPMQPTQEMPANEAAKVCLATARKMVDGSRDAEAIALYERARQHDPKADVAARLAVLYDRAGQTARAAIEYRAAVEMHPKDADIWNDYGYFYLQRDRFDEAEPCLRKALELKPKHARAQNNIALLLGYQGKRDECLAAFEPNVGRAAAHANLGMILAQQGKTSDAVSHLQTALREQPEMPQARAVLACLQR